MRRFACLASPVCSLTAVVGSLIGAEVEPAPVTPPKPEVAAIAEQVEGGGYTFSPPSLDERRDVFYNIVSVVKAETEVAALIKAKNDAAGKTAEPKIKNTSYADTLAGIEEQTRVILDEIREHLRRQEWQKVIDLCNRHLEKLKTFQEQYPDSEAIKLARKQIRDQLVLAEEKLRYEIAKKRFDSLGLVVEGIVWSAEGQSLAIINQEEKALAVNEKVRKDQAVIVSIDRNRVDFMVVHDASTFHFQRYIGDGGTAAR
jgi:hypothetical protein